LRGLVSQTGLSLVLISHQMDLVRAVADDVIDLGGNGRITEYRE
jgi:ABC-type methionine transport system ATPase subunit